MDDKNINIEELLVRILENRADSEEIRYFSKWMEGWENRVYNVDVEDRFGCGRVIDDPVFCFMVTERCSGGFFG